MGSIGDSLDPSGLTRSGNRCLEELVYIATLSHENRISAEWVVVSCATAVETHFNRLLSALIDMSSAGLDRFGNALLDQALDDVFKTWPSRLRWLNQGFNISVYGDTEIQEYLYVVDLRNALVHGQGELTQIQQRNFSELLALKRNLTRTLGVRFRGVKVVMNEFVQTKVLRICRNATMYIDGAVLSSYPSLDV